MCENNNNIAVDQELLDLSRSSKAAYNALEASCNTACMTQLQHKRFDLDINLWVKLNRITKEQADELDKNCDEARDKAVKEFEAHLKEVIDG